MNKILRLATVFGLSFIVFMIFAATAGILRVEGAENESGTNAFHVGASNRRDVVGLNALELSFEPGFGRVLLAPTAFVDLQISLTDFPDPVLAGNILTYTVDIYNNSLETAAAVTMTENLPSAVTLITADSSQGTCTIPICELGTLPGGDSANITLTVEVSSTFSGILSNQVEVTSTETETLPLDNVAIETTEVFLEAEADLSIGKLDDPDPVLAGTALTYTLVITNHGPFDAIGVTVTDTFPVNALSFVDASPGCSRAGPDITCQLNDLGAGLSDQVILWMEVKSGAGNTVNNEAGVYSTTPDPDMGNNRASESTTVEFLSDLSVTTVDDPDPVDPGVNLTYTMTIANSGPSNADGVVFTETLPAEVSLVSINPPIPGSCIGTVCSLGTISAGSSTNVTVITEVDVGATGRITNTANVSSLDPDPQPGNNEDHEVTDIREADLSVGKIGTPNPVTAGNQLAYTVTVTNPGPYDASNVVLTDTLPADVTYVSSPAGCSYVTGLVICNMGTVSSGTGVDVTIVVQVDPDASSPLINTVDITSDSDPNPDNNHAEATTDVQHIADLSITKVGSPDPVAPGGLLTYTLNVINLGPSSATNVIMTDTLPAEEVAFVSSQPGAPICNEDAGVVVCGTWALAPLQSTAVNITVRVNPTVVGPLNNLAQVSSDTEDQRSSNNQATESTAVLESADLNVDTNTDPTNPNPGDMLTYVLTVINNGPYGATGVILTDTLPSEVNFVSSTPPCTHILGVVTCNLGAIATGDFELVTLVGTVDDGASGVITNTAQVSSDLYDALPGNNIDQKVTTVGPGADLRIVKTASPDPVTAGEVLTYSLTVTNLGPSTTPPGVTLTDTLPGNVSYLSSNPGAPACTEASGVVTCNLGAMALDETRNVTIAVQVGSSALNLVTNQAEVQSIMDDPVQGNNSTSISTEVERSSDIEVDIVDDPDPVSNGSILTYTVTVHNSGPSDARNVLLTDILPNEALLLTIDSSQGTCDETICQLGDISAGASAVVSITTVVDAVVPAVLTNTAQAYSQEPDPQMDNNIATETTSVPDIGAPVVHWISPVGDNQRFDVGTEVIQLEADASDNVGVQRVDFLQWDHVNEVFIDIGSVTEAPYRMNFDTSVLYAGYNQIYARAYDTSGNASNRPRILLYRFENRLFMPLIAR